MNYKQELWQWKIHKVLYWRGYEYARGFRTGIIAMVDILFTATEYEG